MAKRSLQASRVEVQGLSHAQFEKILSPSALEFLEELAKEFSPRVASLLQTRRERQARFDQGERPAFLPATQAVREGEWTVAPIPADLLDRRVEITGPVDRKMIINGLNSGANVFMADFEDANSPTWRNCIEGQINLRDAVRGEIEYRAPGGKHYRLQPGVATLMVRPRGWHLPEVHLRFDGNPIPAALMDFGLFFFHNAHYLVEKRNSGPYFYLPKLESHLEARLWNDVFLHAQDLLDLPSGTIRATVLIETLPAAFEMDEILFELREHSAGLNCGRWDYMFSFIKTFRAHPEYVLPDRGQVTMTQPFLRAYTQLVVKTCHRRRIHAMGGMAAQIPIKEEPQANQTAMEKVLADKRRELSDGHDGTWVAHPGLVPLARDVFEALTDGNQLSNLRSDFQTTADRLIQPPTGTRTEAGLRQNVNVGVQYLEAWLGGQGCVPLFYLMEDTATAEISRSQLWQWIHHGARLEDGRTVDAVLFRTTLRQELDRIRASLGEERFRSGHFETAAALMDDLVTSPSLADFLTLPAYEKLIRISEQQ